MPHGEFKQQIARAGASNINMNNEQANAATYADRMANADRILNDPKIVGAMTDVVQKGFSEVPVVGNFMTSENRKLADQAKRDFINAVLRKESGAVISPSEFANAEQQYFPQPGDTPDVIEQRQQTERLQFRAFLGPLAPPISNLRRPSGDSIMATIAEIRQQYPQYQDMTDQQLATRCIRNSIPTCRAPSSTRRSACACNRPALPLRHGRSFPCRNRNSPKWAMLLPMARQANIWHGATTRMSAAAVSMRGARCFAGLVRRGARRCAKHDG